MDNDFNENSFENFENSKVILRDLESLLRKSHLGREVTVIDYKTDNLLPSGENFASSILKVEANIRNFKNGTDETLHLVAKMISNNKYLKSNILFIKEIFVFEELIPMYRKVQLELGFKKKELINFLPKYYGGRLSLKNEDGEFDEDVAYLMENLKLRKYCNMDKKNGKGSLSFFNSLDSFFDHEMIIKKEILYKQEISILISNF